jgi:deoxycytidylate deaminase
MDSPKNTEVGRKRRAEEAVPEAASSEDTGIFCSPSGARALPKSLIPHAKVLKRDDAIPWDDYFMAIAFLSAMRSKDPSTQVGACIVNADKRIVGMGYNGFPRGCSDDELPWCRHADNELDTKYPVSSSCNNSMLRCPFPPFLPYFHNIVCLPRRGECDPKQEHGRCARKLGKLHIHLQSA